MDTANAHDGTQTYRYVIHYQSMSGLASRHGSWQTLKERFLPIVKTILILCLRSVALGLLSTLLLQASIQQRFTPGLNDNSLLHLHNRIHSPDTVRR